MSDNSFGQIPNGFGSSQGGSTNLGTTSGGVGLALNSILTSNAMGSSGVHYTNYNPDSSLQTSLGGINGISGISGPARHHYVHAARMGRRVSDGGPYVAAYKLYIEKRNPQMMQTSIDRSDSVSSSSSVRMLLEEKKKGYGGLPNNHREWLQYKNQVS